MPSSFLVDCSSFLICLPIFRSGGGGRDVVDDDDPFLLGGGGAAGGGGGGGAGGGVGCTFGGGAGGATFSIIFDGVEGGLAGRAGRLVLDVDGVVEPI